MYRIIFILVFIGYYQDTFSQRITRIIDSNLFELKDSTRIKLAGIDAPRLDNPDYFLAETAKDAVLYAQEKFLRKSFSVKVVNENEGIKTVYLIEEYPFGSKLYNLEFLQKGFGKFMKNIDTSDYEKFTEAEFNGIKEHKGIWRVIDSGHSGILDRQYSESERNDPSLTDSLEFVIQTTPKPGFSHVASEVLLGPTIGFISGIPVGVLGVALADDHGEFAGLGEALLGWYLGYLIGNGLTIYAVADQTTKKVNPFGSIIFSALGGGLGIGAAAAFTDNQRNEWLWLAPLVFPVISSVIYVNYIAPDKYPPQNVTLINFRKDKHFTAADLYNSEKVFEVNLFRINF